VVAAVAEICRDTKVEIRGRKALVLGHGRLVGVPVAVWLKEQGADVAIIDKPMPNLADFTKNADIIVCGTGVPGIIKPEMLKHGVVLFDAGTSEDGGVIVGDATPHCEEIASIFTPVPGGIGPITVAMIFKNLLILAQKSAD
jgi:5,10-methylene-tetrahydrofolate dehydrogenase/methenyl tetrahydrofolate cyclohydrolase